MQCSTRCVHVLIRCWAWLHIFIISSGVGFAFLSPKQEIANLIHRTLLTSITVLHSCGNGLLKITAKGIESMLCSVMYLLDLGFKLLDIRFLVASVKPPEQPAG